MVMGINTMSTVKWNARGYVTIEVLTNNSRVGRFTNKMSPSELCQRVNTIHMDTADINGFRVFEGCSDDPLLIAIAFSHMSMSSCAG